MRFYLAARTVDVIRGGQFACREPASAIFQSRNYGL
jgi:hypothetical protein